MLFIVSSGLSFFIAEVLSLGYCWGLAMHSDLQCMFPGLALPPPPFTVHTHTHADRQKRMPAAQVSIHGQHGQRQGP